MLHAAPGARAGGFFRLASRAGQRGAGLGCGLQRDPDEYAELRRRRRSVADAVSFRALRGRGRGDADFTRGKEPGKLRDGRLFDGRQPGAEAGGRVGGRITGIREGRSGSFAGHGPGSVGGCAARRGQSRLRMEVPAGLAAAFRRKAELFPEIYSTTGWNKSRRCGNSMTGSRRATPALPVRMITIAVVPAQTGQRRLRFPRWCFTRWMILS